MDNNGKSLLVEATEKQRAKLGVSHDDSVPWLDEHFVARGLPIPGKPEPIRESVGTAAKAIADRLTPAPVPTPEELAEREKRERARQAIRDQERRESQRQSRQLRWEIMTSSTIGERHGAARFQNFVLYGDEAQQQAQRENLEAVRDYAKGMHDHLKTGKNLILTGARGCGKDHLMAATLYVWVLNGVQSAAWQYGAALWLHLRSLMNKSRRDADTEDEYLHSLCKASVLALSDPISAMGSLTAYQAETLLAVIDTRYRFKRPTLCTLNVESRADAEAKLGPLLVDRLFEDATIVYSSWPSYRQHKPQETANDPEDKSPAAG